MSYAVTSSVGLSLAMSGKCSRKQLSANRTFFSRCCICAYAFWSSGCLPYTILCLCHMKTVHARNTHANIDVLAPTRAVQHTSTRCRFSRKDSHTHTTVSSSSSTVNLSTRPMVARRRSNGDKKGEGVLSGNKMCGREIHSPHLGVLVGSCHTCELFAQAR